MQRLQKSFNPTLTTKSLVPFKNRIPFMCQLFKYYESESTIFLLIDYYQYGPLYPYLRLIRDSIDTYPNNLAQLHRIVATHFVWSGSGRRPSMTSSITLTPSALPAISSSNGHHQRLRLSHSFSGVPSSLLIVGSL